MEIRIRAGIEGDLAIFWSATLETVWRDLPEDEREGLPRAAFEAHFRPRAEQVRSSPETAMLVAESDARKFLGYALVGSATTMLSPLPFGFLYDVWVAPEARRHGVARALLARVEAWCRERGLPRIKLEVAASNLAARSLYAATGYAEERIAMGRTL